jgi:caffeoyl-CoA O-methyltransferase
MRQFTAYPLLLPFIISSLNSSETIIIINYYNFNMQDISMKTLYITAFIFILITSAYSQTSKQTTDLDKTVQAYLNNHKSSYEYANIPEADGKNFYDMIIKNKYKSALEIGTSNGYSSIWIAWALSKTGGKLITIEINENHYKRALENFKEAGLSDYIDARFANAHELIYKLNGPFDFVLEDADISKEYFDAASKKLLADGCFVSHGVRGEYGEYAQYIKGFNNFETQFNTGGGYCISYKKTGK